MEKTNSNKKTNNTFERILSLKFIMPYTNFKLNNTTSQELIY